MSARRSGRHGPAGSRLGTWQPTAAHLRAAVVPLVAALGAVVGGRPDLLVLATPLVGIAVWSVMVRPVVIPTTRVRLGHTTVREGQAAALHVALDCDDGRVDDVSVMIAAHADLEYEPCDGETAAGRSDAALGALDLAVRPIRRGRHRVGPPTIVASSVWASYRWISATTGDARTLVALPRADRFDAVTAPVHTPGLVGGNRSPRAGSGTEFAGIRPFTAGDRLRRIDWPRSLRSGELHVATTWADHDRHLELVVDAFDDVGTSEGVDGRASSLDIAVRAAGAIAEHAIGVGDRVAVVGLGALGIRRTPASSGGRHLRRILELLATIEPAGTRPDDGRIPRGLGADSLVVLLSPLIGAASLARAVSMAARGIRVVVVDCLPADIAAEAPDPLVAIVWRMELLHRETELASARRHGVAVVHWRGPGSLDAVLRHVTGTRVRR